MKALVLGGCGIQGRAALYDLSRNPAVDQVTCADIQPDLIHTFDFLDTTKIQPVGLDAGDPNALASIMDSTFDVVLDFLPPQFIRTVAEAAIIVVFILSTPTTHTIFSILIMQQKKRAFRSFRNAVLIQELT